MRPRSGPGILREYSGNTAITCPSFRKGARWAPSAFQETNHDQDEHQTDYRC